MEKNMLICVMAVSPRHHKILSFNTAGKEAASSSVQTPQTLHLILPGLDGLIFSWILSVQEEKTKHTKLCI